VAQADEARTAGRGVIAITAYKLYFIAASYAVFLALPRLLGTPEAFGLYATTISIVSILHNVLIQGTIQTVSKRVSEDAGRTSGVLRQALKLQLIVGGICAGGLFVFAPLLAERGMLDERMGPLLRIMAAEVFSYALYAALVGSLNGKRLFQRQAGLDVTFTTLRTVGIVGAAALGLGVTGTLSGSAAASAVVLLIALFVVGSGQGKEPIAWKRWLAFMVPLWLYQLSINLTIQVDLIVLKRTLTSIAMSSAELRGEAAQIASRYAGFYRAAQTFAFVPYQLILAVALVVFPMVSKAVGEKDLEAARRYIRQAMRFSLLVLLAVAAPMAGASSGVMRLAYPEAYLAGSGALSVLSFGMVFFALFVVGATALSSSGHPARAAAIGGMAVLIIVTVNLILLHLTGIGPRALTAAALGTSIGTAAALGATGIAVYGKFGAFIPCVTVTRAILAGAAGFAAAYITPHHTRALALAALVCGGLCYLGALFVLRELGARDLQILRRVLPGR
jgi:stage V sporulation protein B